MKRLVLLLAALATLLLPAVAAAKGPSAATITGPGLDKPLKIDGYGEGDSSSPLGLLVTDGGFFAQVFEQTPSLTFKARPKGKLGPRYRVTYTVPGGNLGDSTLLQDLYPYAKSAPVTYMKPSQKFWDTNRTRGGWYRGTTWLKRALVSAGLPAKAPTQKSSSGPTQVAIGAGFGVAVAAAALALLYRRRRASD
jgi:uncharacterized protein (TIGR03382 family)